MNLAAVSAIPSPELLGGVPGKLSLVYREALSRIMGSARLGEVSSQSVSWTPEKRIYSRNCIGVLAFTLLKRRSSRA